MPGAPPRASGPASRVTPLRAWVRATLPIVRELGIALMFVILAAEVSVANPSIPRALRFEHRPEWMVAAVMYPHIFEGWSLFSPEAPLSDETVVVDAVTRDGRHVDPYNEVGSRVSSLPVEQRAGAPRPRLVLVRLHAAHPRCAAVPPGADRMDPALPRADGPRRTITIVRFDAYVIWQDSPKPGEPQVPSNIRKRRFLHYPENAP